MFPLGVAGQSVGAPKAGVRLGGVDLVLPAGLSVVPLPWRPDKKSGRRGVPRMRASNRNNARLLVAVIRAGGAVAIGARSVAIVQQQAGHAVVVSSGNSSAAGPTSTTTTTPLMAV